MVRATEETSSSNLRGATEVKDIKSLKEVKKDGLKVIDAKLSRIIIQLFLNLKNS